MSIIGLISDDDVEAASDTVDDDASETSETSDRLPWLSMRIDGTLKRLGGSNGLLRLTEEFFALFNFLVLDNVKFFCRILEKVSSKQISNKKIVIRYMIWEILFCFEMKKNETEKVQENWERS